MKNIALLLFAASLAFSGCKKCAECNARSLQYNTSTGPVMHEFKYCDKNPNAIENDTMYLDNNLGVDGVPGPSKEKVFVTSCN